MKKAILFDADGVLTLPEEMFSIVYSRSRGLDSAPFDNFFQTEWADYVTGKEDLKEHIRARPQLWQWAGTPEELLEYWFKTEDVKNEEMIKLIQDIRSSGIKCYLATEQERYRGEYMRDFMFKDMFDGYFITAEIGFRKSDPEFFSEILKLLNTNVVSLDPKDVIFFDDSQSKIDAALEAGLDAVLFEGTEKVKQKLSAENLL